MRTSSNAQLREFLDDYAYKKNYGNEDDAIADGFSVDSLVYGQPVKAGGHWDQEKKKAWFDEYEQRTKYSIDSAKATAFESIKQNVEAIRLITGCIVSTEGFGIIPSLDQIDNCSATFTAWYRATQDDAPRLRLANPPLRVQGGSCDAWPKRSIGISPTIVNCRRSGRNALVVTIRTLNGPSGSDHIEALPNLGPKPTGHDVYQDTLTKPATVPITLYHKDFHPPNPPEDLGDYRFTFFSDFRPQNGGKVQSADLIHAYGVGAHFWFCPGPNGYCPHPLFEVVDNGYALRLWAYRDSDKPPIQIDLTLHYFDHENTCVKDCGADVALASWEAENARTCPAIPHAIPAAGLQ